MRKSAVHAPMRRSAASRAHRSAAALPTSKNRARTRACGKWRQNPAYVVSGASGAHAATAAEKAALESVSAAYRGISGLTGHLREAQFPLALALGAISVWKGEAFAPLDASEKPASGAVSEAIVTTIGATRAEGAAKLVRA